MREVFRRNAKGTESPAIDLVITGITYEALFRESTHYIRPVKNNVDVICRMILENEGSMLLIGNGYLADLRGNCAWTDKMRYRSVWLKEDHAPERYSKKMIVFRNYAKHPEEKALIRSCRHGLYVNDIRRLLEELLREYVIEALA